MAASANHAASAIQKGHARRQLHGGNRSSITPTGNVKILGPSPTEAKPDNAREEGEEVAQFLA
jgi:hypothetical protein